MAEKALQGLSRFHHQGKPRGEARALPGRLLAVLWETWAKEHLSQEAGRAISDRHGALGWSHADMPVIPLHPQRVSLALVSGPTEAVPLLQPGV